MNCYLCKKKPAIENSHVVPNFMSKHLKKNSPFGYMLNTWSPRPVQDLYKGPYFCRNCDNEVISGWESFFASRIWKDPLKADDHWGHEKTLNFVLSLAYRYAIHFIKNTPIQRNIPYSNGVMQLARKAIDNNSEVGKSVFIYPYVHRPIEKVCALVPGINHLLSLSVCGRILRREGDLPNAFLVIVPKMVFLFCESDLSSVASNPLHNPVHLTPGTRFSASSSNLDMPIFLKTLLNRLVNEGQSHQKNIGRWKSKLLWGDEYLAPRRVCYEAALQDKRLSEWRRKNCSG